MYTNSPESLGSKLAESAFKCLSFPVPLPVAHIATRRWRDTVWLLVTMAVRSSQLPPSSFDPFETLLGGNLEICFSALHCSHPSELSIYYREEGKKKEREKKIDNYRWLAAGGKNRHKFLLAALSIEPRIIPSFCFFWVKRCSSFFCCSSNSQADLSQKR